MAYTLLNIINLAHHTFCNTTLNCSVVELLEAPAGFMHFYDEKGEWQGIIKKPVVANRGVLQEEEKKIETVRKGSVWAKYQK